MSKKKLLTVTALSLTTFLMFTGCSSDKAPEESTSTSQTTESTTQSTVESTTESSASTESTAAPEAGTDRKANDLVGLIGKADAEIVALLGEGTPTSDDTGKVTARDYNFTIFGKENISSISYNEEGMTSMIIVNAAVNEFDEWDKLLTEELGATEDASTDNTEGSNTKEKIWTMENNVILSLKDAYDTLSLEIFIGA